MQHAPSTCVLKGPHGLASRSVAQLAPGCPPPAIWGTPAASAQARIGPSHPATPSHSCTPLLGAPYDGIWARRRGTFASSFFSGRSSPGRPLLTLACPCGRSCRPAVPALEHTLDCCGRWELHALHDKTEGSSFGQPSSHATCTSPACSRAFGIAHLTFRTLAVCSQLRWTPNCTKSCAAAPPTAPHRHNNSPQPCGGPR